jgi:Tfp pilus assembly protein PilF
MLGIGLTLLIAASVRTYARAGEWADIEAFYLGEMRYAPEPGRIYNNLGMHYADHHDEAKAIHYYQLAASSPTGQVFAQPHHNLAVAFLNAGRREDAMRQIRLALRIDPRFVYSLQLLHDVFAASHDDLRSVAVAEALRELQSTGNYDVAALVAVAFGPE